jgi:hypothetical protein
MLLLAYLLAAMGLTILIVWPTAGPGCWVRERLLRTILPGPLGKVLDCYICLGFWSGLILGVVWWLLFDATWAWFGCLMVPAVFWLVLPGSRSKPLVSSGGEVPP